MARTTTLSSGNRVCAALVSGKLGVTLMARRKDLHWWILEASSLLFLLGVGAVLGVVLGAWAYTVKWLFEPPIRYAVAAACFPVVPYFCVRWLVPMLWKLHPAKEPLAFGAAGQNASVRCQSTG